MDAKREELAANPSKAEPEPQGGDEANQSMVTHRQMQRRAERRKPQVDVAVIARGFVAAGIRDVNHLTDQVFWLAHPDLAGQKLEAGTPEATEWIELRDQVVKPAIEAAPKPAAGAPPGGAAHAAGTPAAAPAHAAAPPVAATPAPGAAPAHAAATPAAATPAPVAAPAHAAATPAAATPAPVAAPAHAAATPAAATPAPVAAPAHAAATPAAATPAPVAAPAHAAATPAAATPAPVAAPAHAAATPAAPAGAKQNAAGGAAAGELIGGAVAVAAEVAQIGIKAMTGGLALSAGAHAAGLDKKAEPAAGGATHGADDHYYTQGKNTYEDSGPKWYLNSATQNTCNMTSTTMAIVSLAGGDEGRVRTVMADVLRHKHLPPGAHFTIDSKDQPVEKVLADDSLLSKLNLPDLLTAVAVAETGKGSVVQADTIMRVAKETGLVKSAKHHSDGEMALSTPDGRARAKAALDKGERIIIDTPNHFIYLLDVTGDGILVHDPAGMRCNGSASPPWFLGSGVVAKQASVWLSLIQSNNWREIAERRAQGNPKTQAVITKLVEISRMEKAKQKEAMKELAQNNEHLEMGERNFYGPEDYKAFGLNVRFELSADDSLDKKKH